MSSAQYEHEVLGERERAIYNDTAAFMKSIGLGPGGATFDDETFSMKLKSNKADNVISKHAKAKDSGRNGRDGEMERESTSVSNTTDIRRTDEKEKEERKWIGKEKKTEKKRVGKIEENVQKLELSGKREQRIKGAKGARWGKGAKSSRAQSQQPEPVPEIEYSKNEGSITYWWKKNNKIGSSTILPSPENGSAWYDLTPRVSLPEVDSSSRRKKLAAEKLNEISSNVEAIFAKEVQAYQRRKAASRDADRRWMEDVIHSGTLSDRVAALTLKIQESPVHELASLDALLSMAEKKEQRTSQMALEAIKDLLIHNLLPDRKLNTFHDYQYQLLDANMSLKTGLAYWYEAQLKLRVERLVNAIEIFMKSSIDYFKKNCMNIGMHDYTAVYYI